MTVTNEVTTSPTEEEEDPTNPGGNAPAPVNPVPTDTTNGPEPAPGTETTSEPPETSDEREPSFPTLPTIPNGGGRGNDSDNGNGGNGGQGGNGGNHNTARPNQPGRPQTNDNATSADNDVPAELRNREADPESQPVL